MKVINVKGTIVNNDNKWIYDYLGIEAVCPKDVEEVIATAEKNENITVKINSDGGDVGAGNEIAYIIKQYAGNTTADIVGYCCSSATLISCAADRVRMLPSALYMIHNVSGGASGDYRELAKGSGVLKTASEAISKAYQIKTGMSEQELLSLMDNETWLNSSQALEYGFIDEVIGEKPTTSLINSFGMVLPDEAIQKIRNMCINQPDKTEADFLIQKNKAQLKLLRMKGE